MRGREKAGGTKAIIRHTPLPLERGDEVLAWLSYCAPSKGKRAEERFEGFGYVDS